MKHYLQALATSALTNAEVAELATRIVIDYGTLPPPGPRSDVGPMDAYMQKITQLSGKFDKGVNRIVKNVDTQKVAELDEIRDNAVASFFKSVKVDLTSDDPVEVEHANRLMIVVDAYRGVARLSFEVETKALETMCTDLSDGVYANSVEALGLKKYVDRI
jgi:hypothetical protein